MVKESGSQPAPQDKARVYFIGRGESAAGSGIIGPVRVGMDGDWVGAVKGRSYLAVAAPPGVHHFCAEWPGNRGINGVALNLLDLKPGQAYYLVVNSLSDPATPPDVLMLHEEAAREAFPFWPGRGWQWPTGRRRSRSLFTGEGRCPRLKWQFINGICDLQMTKLSLGRRFE